MQGHVVQSSFATIKYCKVKLLVENSATTEINELKNIKFMFKIFRMQIFDIYKLKLEWQN